MIILNDIPEQRKLLLNKLIKQISEYKIPIVPNRYFKTLPCIYKKNTQKPKKALFYTQLTALVVAVRSCE